MENYAYIVFAHLLRRNPAYPLHAKSVEAAESKILASAALLRTLNAKEREEGVSRFIATEYIN
jgi:hypothetical protein